MKKLTSYTFILLLSVICISAYAQKDSMIIHKDSRIDLLLKKQSDINKLAAFKTSNGKIKGFRIMVLNTNNRDLAYKTKAQLLSLFPEYASYMSYQAPFFKLKIGDFLKKEDAEDLRKQLGTLFPKGVFVIPDIIVIRPQDEKRLLEDIENNKNSNKSKDN